MSQSISSPHLGQAGPPYAKTVPSKTHILEAHPFPGDVFDSRAQVSQSTAWLADRNLELMARTPKGRKSNSGLSAMLIYHTTIVNHG